jgi:hypothetical protein
MGSRLVRLELIRAAAWYSIQRDTENRKRFLC